MSHPYHVFDETQDPFRFNAAGEIVRSSPTAPLSGSQVEHLASPLHHLHSGHLLESSSPDPCYTYYGHSVTTPSKLKLRHIFSYFLYSVTDNRQANPIEPIMEPITTVENHNGGSLHWDPSASLQAFASEGNVAIPKTMMMSYHVEPYNVSLPPVQSNHGELGDANCTRGLSNLSETTFMSSDSSNTTTYPRTVMRSFLYLPVYISQILSRKRPQSQVGSSSSPATVNNFVTSGSSTPQEHVILPSILPGNKDQEAYIATFTKDGKPFFKCLWKRCKGTAFWERDEIHKHVKAHIIKITHECLCGSIFSNFQAAQKHCRNAKSTGNICPTCSKTYKRNDYFRVHSEKCKGKGKK
ncbi:hypothetical protein M422DRAFT_243651 [Sphaerobolus stellatus SS14]|nr:hypothetical protein M422DRAFT_243651 [Sphaerobolus stellatus SS14]